MNVPATGWLKVLVTEPPCTGWMDHHVRKLSVDLIAPRPLLLIVGREAATAWMSIEAYQKARAPKELYWIEGATHYSLYDTDECVSPAVARLTEFFETNLTEVADEVAFA